MSEVTTRVLITGASSGIGLAAAQQVAAAGVEVVMVSRDPVRGQAAAAKVAALATGPRPTFAAADLSSQAAIRDRARRLHERHASIDVLVNDARTASRRREPTIDGVEGTFATNHLAPFLLTHLTLDLLLQASAGRSAEGGAREAVDLATSPGWAAATGLCLVRGRPARSKPIACDAGVAARLWSISEQLTSPGLEITQPDSTVDTRLEPARPLARWNPARPAQEVVR